MIFTHFLCSKNHFERNDGKPFLGMLPQKDVH
jgi:hypothetical protein